MYLKILDVFKNGKVQRLKALLRGLLSLSKKYFYGREQTSEERKNKQI